MPALDDVPTRQNAAHKMTKNVCTSRRRQREKPAHVGANSQLPGSNSLLDAYPPSAAEHSHKVPCALSVCLTESVERDHEHRDAHEQSAELQRQTDDRQPQRRQHARRGSMIVAGRVADGQGIGDVVLLCSVRQGADGRRNQTKPNERREPAATRLRPHAEAGDAVPHSSSVVCLRRPTDLRVEDHEDGDEVGHGEQEARRNQLRIQTRRHRDG